ncbi:hypothetical protein [Rubritalea marina]|uniref:hypothetical protein n=1 Tax=Rubritalea marina TaxID=361055 RepID=UPI00039F7B48|nr:hypothetical protein [Rubritalea marina]
MSSGEYLSEVGMGIAGKAIDQSSEIIKEGLGQLVPMALFLTNDGEISINRFVAEPDQVSKLAQAEIDKVSDSIVAYAIARDGYTTFDGIRRDSIIVEAGCRISGKGIMLVQQYSEENGYEELGNIKLTGQVPLRIKNSDHSRQDFVELIQPLLKAPYVVFQKVAGADGIIEKDEMKAFTSILKDGLDSDNPFVVACIEQSIQNSSEYLKLVNDREMNPRLELPAVRELIISNFVEVSGEDYIDFLKDLASKIAQPKGGFLGVGKKLRPEEVAAIELVEELLS